MSDNVHIIANVSSCQTIKSSASIICLPTRKDCSPGCRDKLLVPCDQTYNCNRSQSQTPFTIPYRAGDKIMFQTQFLDIFNPDETSPIDGWGTATFMRARLRDNNTDTVVSTDVSEFASRYLVGYDGEKSYQLLEIDTSLIKIACFSITIQAYDTNGNITDELCTQDFEIIEDWQESVLVSSTYSNEDCCGHYYGDPVSYVGTSSFSYNNTLRYLHKVETKSFAFEKPSNDVGKGRKVFRSVETKKERWLRLQKPIPEYLADFLVHVHLAGEMVFVDNESYIIENYETDNVAGCMWHFEILLEQYCKTNYKC